MGLLSGNSAMTSGVTLNTTKLAQSQNILERVAPKTTAAVEGAITNVVNKVATSITGGTGNPSKGAVGGVRGVVSTLEGYLSKAASSIGATLSSADTSLASGISGVLGGAFGNTVTPGSATVQTKIPDPVSSMMNKSTPTSSMFSLSSTSGVPTAVAATGKSTTATGASLLTGTQLATLISKYNLGSTSSLSQTLMSNQKTAGVGGLYTSLFPQTGSVLTSTISSAADVVTAGEQQVSSVESSIGSAKAALGSGSATSILDYLTDDEVSTFLNQQQDATTGVIFTGTNASGTTPVMTTTSSTTTNANTVNAIASTAQAIGCSGAGINYASQTQQLTLYNLAMYVAAKNGLTSMFESLASCNLFSSTGVQQALQNTFTSVSKNHIGVANAIITKMTNPTAVNTPAVQQGIVTNKTLTTADVPTVADTLTKMGAATTSPFASSLSTPTTPVVDTAVAANTNTTILDGLLGGSLISDVLNGTTVSRAANGQYSLTA